MNKYRYLLSSLYLIDSCLFQSCGPISTIYDVQGGTEILIRLDITPKPDTLFLSLSGSSTTLGLTATYQRIVTERNAGLLQVIDVTQIDTVQSSYQRQPAWVTTNANVANVTNGGVVTPRGLGVCNITATAVAEEINTPPLIVKVH